MNTTILNAPPAYHSKTMPSPVGRLTLIATERGLAAVLWEDDDPKRTRFILRTENTAHPVLLAAESQLADYFAGERTLFSVKLDPTGTPFQVKVWQALAEIPFGETRSYGEIARRIGQPTAVRAVGAANGRNPISIIVPCHRVIGASGRLIGFAGGLAIKEKLLQLERRPRN